MSTPRNPAPEALHNENPQRAKDRAMKKNNENVKFCVHKKGYDKLKVEEKKTAIHAARKPIGILRNSLRTQPNNLGDREHELGGTVPSCQTSPVPLAARYEEVHMEGYKGCEGAPLLGKALGMALENTSKTTVEVDIRKYQAWLDDPDLSDEQKEQIVKALWQIIICFVDLGFGVSPLQVACGQLSEIEGACGEEAKDVVRSDAVNLSDTSNTIAAE